MVKVSLVTLHRWLAAGKFRPSIGVPMKGRTLWRFRATDVKRLRAYKARFYGKGKGPKPKRKL